MREKVEIASKGPKIKNSAALKKQPKNTLISKFNGLLKWHDARIKYVVKSDKIIKSDLTLQKTITYMYI